jgi:hypothetical protein
MITKGNTNGKCSDLLQFIFLTCMDKRLPVRSSALLWYQIFNCWEFVNSDTLYDLCEISISTSRDSSVSIALGYGLGDRGFDSLQGLGIFLFTTVSRAALGPTQPPIQWVPGALSLEINQSGREADQSHPSSAEVKKCVVLYLHFPICLNGLVLS